jgi:predicted nucleic acid-binding Zn ribbon protein
MINNYTIKCAAPGCTRPLYAKRKDANTCSDRCRKRLSDHRKRERRVTKATNSEHTKVAA